MSILNTLVDRIFIINLAIRPDRYEKIKSQLDALNITNYERFDAVVATNEPYISDPQIVQFFQRGLCTGIIGCTISHVKMVEIAKERGYKQILVLEDDAFFQEGFEEKMKAVVEQLKTVQDDWKLLYLGANHKKKGVPVTENIKKVTKAFCLHAYIIRDSLYDEILRDALTQPIEGDVYYGEILVQKHVFLTIFPNLVTQYPSMNNMFNTFADYDLEDA